MSESIVFRIPEDSPRWHISMVSDKFALSRIFKNHVFSPFQFLA
jgi:hypothetical protein